MWEFSDAMDAIAKFLDFDGGYDFCAWQSENEGRADLFLAKLREARKRKGI